MRGEAEGGVVLVGEAEEVVAELAFVSTASRCAGLRQSIEMVSLTSTTKYLSVRFRTLYRPS